MPFSQKTLDFLFENRLQDSREWFGEHKAEYNQYVLAPLRELVRALAPCMLEMDNQLTCEPKVDRTICRIWRDTRYSRDKSLYRDTMWVIFKRGKMHGTEVPGLYFEIGGDGFNYGCGFYHASTGYMDTLRGMILEPNEAFIKAQEAFLGQNIYHMEGDCYKRPRFARQPEPLRQWLERRNISFVAESRDFELLFSTRLAEKLTEDFRALAPVYRFLLRAALEERQRKRT